MKIVFSCFCLMILSVNTSYGLTRCINSSGVLAFTDSMCPDGYALVSIEQYQDKPPKQEVDKRDDQRNYESNKSEYTPKDNIEACQVLNFSSYHETASSPQTMSTQRYGVNQEFGNSVVSGGGEQKIATYLSVTIKNNTYESKYLSIGRIEVRTIKGNMVTPKSKETGVRIGPGETKTLDGLKFVPPLSQATNVKCSF